MSGGGASAKLSQAPLFLLVSWKALGVPVASSGPALPGKMFGYHALAIFITVAFLQGFPPPSCQQYVQGSFSPTSLACQWLRESQALRGDSTGLAKSLAASVCDESVSCSLGCEF